jgi:hypothetical protein
MTPENLAKYRLDPNIDFWRELKTGSDNFEVTHEEVVVGVCDRRYVFNAEPANGMVFDPNGPCPPLKHDDIVEAEVLAKQKRDDAKIAELVAEGVQPVHTVYADGGQNPTFASIGGEVSRPDALAEGPVDVAIENRGRSPTLAQLEAAKARDLAEAAAAERKANALLAVRSADDPGKTEPTPPAADAQTASSPPPQPAQNPGSFFTSLFSPHPTTTQPPAEGAAVQQTPDASGGGLVGFYQGTQPSRQALPPVAAQDSQ